MKKILYAAAALCLFASCAKEAPFSPDEESGKPFSININFQTKAGGSGDEDKPKVNSIRVLVFDADASSPDGTYGKCVFNEYYPFGFTVSRKTSGGTGYYQAALTSRINISSKASKFNVYAVLNEDGYEMSSAHGAWSDSVFDPDNGLTSETDLRTLLTEITHGVSESTFQNIYASSVSYAAAVKTEPAFLICAYTTNVEFDDDDLKSPDPVTLLLNTPDIGRPMAQITIDKITTDANPDGPGTFVSDLAKVFVIGVELDNVPNSFQWNATDNVLGTSLTSIPVSATNIITDEQGDTYYNRYWPGEVTTEVEVNASVKQETNERLYRTKNDGKVDSWNFPDLLGDPPAFNFQYYYIGETDNYKKNQATSQASYVQAKFLKGDNFLKYQADANGPKMDKLGKLVKLFYTDEMLVNEFTVTGPTTSQGIKSGTALKYSDDNWTVNLGDTYYVPENIQTTSTGATCLKITLAVASPELDLSEVLGTDYPQPGDFTVPGASDNDDGFSYFLDNTNLKTGFSGDNDSNAVTLFQNNSHIVWYDDLDHEVTSADDHNSYAVYVSGFYRTASGSGTATVSNSQKGSVFKWNVPTEDTSTTHVFEYTIPINNNQDGSYSVLRNTRYKVTLHVTKTAYDDLLTKSAAAPGIGISAEVVTEKIEDNE